MHQPVDRLRETIRKVNALVERELGREGCQCYAMILVDYEGMATYAYQDDSGSGLLDALLSQVQKEVRNRMIETDDRINTTERSRTIN